MGHWGIYFIQYGESGPIKIGRTDHVVDDRKRALQTASPAPLRLLFCRVEDGDLRESILHDEFRHSRIRGEWFFPDRCLIERIEALQLEFPRRQLVSRPHEEWPKPGSPINSISRAVPKSKQPKVQLSVQLRREEVDEIRQLYSGSGLVEMEQLAELIRLGIRARLEQERHEEEKRRSDQGASFKRYMETRSQAEIAELLKEIDEDEYGEDDLPSP